MKKYIITIILFITPAVAFAAPGNLSDLMRLLVKLLNQAVVIIGALALLFFFWGMAQLILNADNEDKKKASKSIMVWGIIILFVMFSIGGILKVLDNTFFAGSGGGSIRTPATSGTGSSQLKGTGSFFNEYPQGIRKSDEEGRPYILKGIDRRGNEIRTYEDTQLLEREEIERIIKNMTR